MPNWLVRESKQAGYTHLSLSSMASHSFSTSPAAAAAASAAAAVAMAGAPLLLLSSGLLGGATSSQPAWLLRASSSCRPVPAWLDQARTCSSSNNASAQQHKFSVCLGVA